MKLGNKIKKYRLLNDLSQKELGMKVLLEASVNIAYRQFPPEYRAEGLP